MTMRGSNAGILGTGFYVPEKILTIGVQLTQLKMLIFIMLMKKQEMLTTFVQEMLQSK